MRWVFGFLGLAALAALVSALPGILGWDREEDAVHWRE
jgi:hypothetical protein